METQRPLHLDCIAIQTQINNRQTSQSGGRQPCYIHASVLQCFSVNGNARCVSWPLRLDCIDMRHLHTDNRESIQIQTRHNWSSVPRADDPNQNRVRPVNTQTHTKNTQTDPMRLCAKRVLARLTCVIMINMNARVHVSACPRSGVASLLIPVIAVLVTHASAPTPFTPVETRRAQPVYPRPWTRSYDWRRLLCGDVHALRRVGGAWEARASGSVTSDF